MVNYVSVTGYQRLLKAWQKVFWRPKCHLLIVIFNRIISHRKFLSIPLSYQILILLIFRLLFWRFFLGNAIRQFSSKQPAPLSQFATLINTIEFFFPTNKSVCKDQINTRWIHLSFPFSKYLKWFLQNAKGNFIHHSVN